MPQALTTGHSGPIRLAVVLCLLFLTAAGFADVAEKVDGVPTLREYTSDSYVIHTDLDRAVAANYARHMDEVFVEYRKRFRSFRSQRQVQMPLYLFATEAGYTAFLKAHDIDATNSAGMFVYTRKLNGLLTYLEGKSRQEVFEVLQHEGFHQFALQFIGPHLPIWANEGLAQYFEDGIMVRKRMHLGVANARRLRLVQQALKDGTAIPFNDVLNIDSDGWSGALRTDLKRSSLLYAQSWTMAYFLIHADKGKYRPMLETYLQAMSRGMTSQKAFEFAFRVRDTKSFEARWKEYVTALEPDPLTTAVERLEYLANAVKFLKERSTPIPGTITELESALKRIRYRAWRTWPGIRVDYQADDATLYQYPGPDGKGQPFQMLEASRDDLPPRITAPGLKPEPTLEWSRVDDELVAEITFR